MRHTLRRLLILAAFLLLLVGFWLFETRSLKTDYFTVRSARLPASFDGLRIVSLSDLHGVSFGRGNRRLLSAVRAARPDLIVLVGDMADASTDLTVLETLCRGLPEIAPTFYVTGNHEWKRSDVPAVLSLLEDCGVTVLANEYRVLERGEDRILLAGVHDPNGPADMLSPAKLNRQIRDAYPDDYLIVLNHRNTALSHWAKRGADLLLSGHAHGGVIRLPFLGGLIGSGMEWLPDHTAGLYTEGGTTMAVNRGLGYTGVNVRLFNRPEVMVIDLKREAPDA